jgi:hypothetical protein
VCGDCQAPAGRVLKIDDAELSELASDYPGPAAQKNFLKLYNEFLTTHLDHRFTTFGFLESVLAE